MKIILLEDDPDMLETLAEALELNDHIVMRGGSGDDGLALLREGESLPDLILSDVNMPGMTGLEFVAAVKANVNWQLIPICIVSGSVGDEVAALQAGATAFLVKPFQFAELNQLLSHL